MLSAIILVLRYSFQRERDKKNNFNLQKLSSVSEITKTKAGKIH